MLGSSSPRQYLALYAKVRILFQFFKNDRVNHKDRLIKIALESTKKNFSVKSEELTRGQSPSYTQ